MTDKGDKNTSLGRPDVETLEPTPEMLAHRKLLREVIRGEKHPAELEAAVSHIPGAVEFLRRRKVLK
jgi:hypothetical protein